MAFNALDVRELLDVADDCIEQLEKRSGEITGEDEDYLAETAKRFLALASHFSPSIHEELVRRFPHVPDEVLVAKPHHTVVDWPDAPGAHEGAPFRSEWDAVAETCIDPTPVASPVHPLVGARLDEIMKPNDLLNSRKPTEDEIRGLVNLEYKLRQDEASIFTGGTPIVGGLLGEVPESERVEAEESDER